MLFFIYAWCHLSHTILQPSTKIQMIIRSKPESNGEKKLMNHDEPNDQYNQRNYPSDVYADLVPFHEFCIWGSLQKWASEKKACGV
ncbi:uncharacterized protein SPAR_H02140 [Saccharomyces paradoxus]|uniref:Uncharacterized protein n=1 Tax=Saccharomyces paradoxus TaxID=27291 RepID=A0A8B8UT14_SACPA|nr:uncharacterized protein SPAR_H02140 [Saccharomyces paradoxus]QHS73809.1 hypothetical protein SPAR_H02140 [Saccharomyces paradoxus]